MRFLTVIITLGALAGAAAASDVYFNGFETQGLGYTTSVAEFSDGSYDYFTQTDGSNISGGASYGGPDGSFFAGMDLDGEGAGLPLVLTTSTFSIAGASNLQFMIDLAEDKASDGHEDWDAGDYVAFEYSVDGGGWQGIFGAVNDGSTFNSAAFIGGVEITDSFSTFSADLSGVSGSSLAIRLVWQLDSGDEDLAIDNLRVSGDLAVVPLPSALLAGAGLLGLLGAGRLRRR